VRGANRRALPGGVCVAPADSVGRLTRLQLRGGLGPLHEFLTARLIGTGVVTRLGITRIQATASNESCLYMVPILPRSAVNSSRRRGTAYPSGCDARIASMMRLPQSSCESRPSAGVRHRRNSTNRSPVTKLLPRAPQGSL
jgi:hypothetical protein